MSDGLVMVLSLYGITLLLFGLFIATAKNPGCLTIIFMLLAIGSFVIADLTLLVVAYQEEWPFLLQLGCWGIVIYSLTLAFSKNTKKFYHPPRSIPPAKGTGGGEYGRGPGRRP